MRPSNGQNDWTYAFDYDPTDMCRPLVRRFSSGSKAQAGTRPGARKRKGYYVVGIAGLRYPLHRIIWEWHNGDISDKMFVDHIDNNPENNRIENLQLLTAMDNSRKQLKVSINTSDYKGVSRNIANKRWTSQIKVNGIAINLASSKSKKRAARVNDRAQIQRALYDAVDVKTCRKKAKVNLTPLEFKLLSKLLPDHVLNFPLHRYITIGTVK